MRPRLRSRRPSPAALPPGARLSAVLVAGLLLAAPPARASSAVREASLKDVLAHTDAAVVVSLAQPPSAEVRIPITPAGEKPDPKRWPDFVRRDRRLKVVEVLWHRDGAEPKGVIQVTPGQWRTRLTVHRRYHIENVRKIPIFRRFPGRDGLKALHTGAGKAIVLLGREAETGWRMAAEMAFLPMKARRRLLKALAVKKPKRARVRHKTRGARGRR